VYVNARDVTPGAGANDAVRTVLRSGGTDYFGSSNTLTDSYTEYYTDYAQNPADSEDWEWTDIDNLEAGIDLYGEGTVYPRGTQVYVVVSYESSDTEDAKIKLGIQFPATEDVKIRIGISIRGTVDAKISVGINNPENFDLCKYDTTNNRWDNGDNITEVKRYIDVISDLKRKEEINKLSVLTFKLITNDSELLLEVGDIIALGTEFGWVGESGNSDSQFGGKLYFEGIITEVKKTIKVKIGSDYVQAYSVTAMHIVHSLSQEYEQRLVSVRRCLWGGDEKYGTPAWHIRDLLEDMTYYDKNGDTVSADDLPIYIRRCPTYINHKEYTDKNKLEILLDLCNQSTNIFYCHDDGFYFEPIKPSMGTAYFNQPNWMQGFHRIGYDSSFKMEYQVDFADNSWDVESNRYLYDRALVYLPFYNTSKSSQTMKGMGIWITDDNSSGDLDAHLYSISAKTISYIQQMGTDEYDSTITGFQRNAGVWNDVLSAQTQYFIGVRGTDIDGSGDYTSIGISRPASFFNPVAIKTDHSTNGERDIFRSNISPSAYFIINDQMRFLNPLYPSQFMIYCSNTPTFSTTQTDGYIMQGYNPLNDRFCMSTIGLCDDEVKGDDTTFDYGSVLAYARDWTHISSLGSGSGVNSAIDEDIRLVGWDDEIKEFAVEVLYTNYGIMDATGVEVGVIFNLDWDNNGIKDAIWAKSTYTVFPGYSYIKLMKYEDDSESQLNSGNTTHDPVKFRYWFRNDSSNCKAKVDYEHPSNPGTWYDVIDWTSTNVTSTGNGIGLTFNGTTGYEGVIYAHIFVSDEFNKTLDMDLCSDVKITEPRPTGQYIVMGEDSDSVVRVPIGKYPDTPDTDGNIQIIKKKVETNQAAYTLAKQLYESETEKSLELKYHEDLLDDTLIHYYIKPNKMIEFDSTDYYVTSIDTTFMDMGCTSKIKAGYKSKSYFDYIEQKAEDKKIEQSRATSPIMTEYEMAEIDNTEHSQIDFYNVGGDHTFVR
jgi:hypothetical protein